MHLQGVKVAALESRPDLLPGGELPWKLFDRLQVSRRYMNGPLPFSIEDICSILDIYNIQDQETREEIKSLKSEIQTMKTEQQNDKRASSAQASSWVGIGVAILALLVSYFK